MKLSKLIAELQETLNLNGDVEVNGVANGEVFGDIELNCLDISPLYVELYKTGSPAEQAFPML